MGGHSETNSGRKVKKKGELPMVAFCQEFVFIDKTLMLYIQFIYSLLRKYIFAGV